MKAIALPNTSGTAWLLAAMLAVAGVHTARAQSSIVVDVATGDVLSEKDATARRYPASTTKLMTAYIALKALKEGSVALDSPVVMTRFAASQAPSKMGFEPGSVMRLDHALRMMLVKSANDVAVAIGQSLAGGSIEGFIAMMNRQAAALQMMDTRFINPNGLPGPGQFSSAKDLAILGSALRRDFPGQAAFFATEAIATGGATLKNTNALLGRFDGADGMKTGYICASGFNIVASATRGGRTLVAVVLGGDGPIVRDRLTAELLENGFKTMPVAGSRTIWQLPASDGPPVDISGRICSPAGRTARANEQKAQEKNGEAPASPYLTEMTRPPSAVRVGLGGAAGSDRVAAGISLIAAYGIPLPTPRPMRPGETIPPAPVGPSAELRGSAAEVPLSASRLADDLGVIRRTGVPIPTPRATN